MNKRSIVILLFPFLGLASAQAQKIVVTQSTIECGRTGYQQPITATFQLRNKSHRKLVIESIKPDCGCTTVEYPREVGANDKFTITMTYDARQLGHFQKMAAIILGFKISKAQQLSNWEAEKLSESQQRYAATDAWVCREMYLRLMQSEKAPLTPQQLHPELYPEQA